MEEDQETSQRRPWRKKMGVPLFVLFLCVGVCVFVLFKMPQNDIDSPSFKKAFMQTFHTYFVKSVQTFADDHWLSAEEKMGWREKYEKYPAVFRVRVLPVENGFPEVQVLEILKNDKASNKNTSYLGHHGKLETENVPVMHGPYVLLGKVAKSHLFRFTQKKYIGLEVLLFGYTTKFDYTTKKGIYAYQAFLIPRDLEKNILPYLRNMGKY